MKSAPGKASRLFFKLYSSLKHSVHKNPKLTKYLRLPCILAGAFVLGAFAGKAVTRLSDAQATVQTEPAPADTGSFNWGLGFQEEGIRPSGNASIEELAQYNAYYAQDTDEKILYLTFDAGYENGNTPAILEALKKHHAPATFFVVGNFISDQPELIQQMIAEEHTIGNHTMTHPDMSAISSKEAFQKELSEVEALYQELTGKPMIKFYRPPRGIYSTANLSMAKELGYSTFFWSLAYVDWIQEQQPSKEEAFSKLLPRVHPGAIVLLHNTSSTNAAILDELLTRWEEMGYRFGSLQDLIGQG